MNASIRDIAYHLPERIVTNEELAKQNPTWDMALIESTTGVSERHVAAPGETALDLAYQACLKLFQANPEAKQRIDGIVCCTHSGDYITPPNACVLHEWLGLSKNVYAVDISLACSGYVYGLAMVKGLIAANIASNVLLINTDTYSRFVHPHDRATAPLFGDGAAVTLIEASDASRGIIDVACATSGTNHEWLMIPAGGCRLPRSPETEIEQIDRGGNITTPEHLHMDGLGVLMFVNSNVPEQVLELLDRNSLAIDDIDLFVFHQASKVALDSLSRLLRIREGRSMTNLRTVGNTVSASIPIALSDAIESGRAVRGDVLLMSGFGAGLSWGTALVEL